MVKLFVGGFSPDTQEIELVQLIALYGQVVTIKIVRDKQTQKSKGYAFLEMTDLEGAKNAISVLNGTKMGSRELTINLVAEEIPPIPQKTTPAREIVYSKVNSKPDAPKKKRPRKTG